MSDAQFILLDLCTVRADPPMELDHERLELPTTIMNEFNMKIEGTQTSEGLVISSKYYSICVRMHSQFHFVFIVNNESTSVWTIVYKYLSLFLSFMHKTKMFPI